MKKNWPNEEETDDDDGVRTIQVSSKRAKNVWNNCVSFSCRRAMKIVQMKHWTCASIFFGSKVREIYNKVD